MDQFSFLLGGDTHEYDSAKELFLDYARSISLSVLLRLGFESSDLVTELYSIPPRETR